jgi:hypothetical protein
LDPIFLVEISLGNIWYLLYNKYILTETGNKMITETQFEQLPKEEQNFRWALFLKSNGGEKDLTSNIIEELKQKYLVRKEKLDKKLFGQ